MTHKDARIAKPEVFVGRAEELRQLHQALDKSLQAKRLQVVFIGGEAGTGKTTLVERFIFEASQKVRNLQLGRGKCTSENDLDGLSPFLQVLDDLYELSKKDKSWWEHLRANPWFEFFKEVAPAWLDILTAGIASAAKTTIEETQKLRQSASLTGSLFSQFVRLLSTQAHKQPLLIFLDDMQWSDRSSIDLLFHLSRQLRDVPVCIVIAYRPSELTDEKNDFQEVKRNIVRYGGVEIPDLTQGIDVADYVGQRFQSNTFPASFLLSIQKKTEGYPLFVGQIFDWLLENGSILSRNVDGVEQWYLAKPELALSEIPNSVQAAIDNRIQHLDARSRDILTYASVEGEEFTAQVISQILKIDELEILETLENLEQKYRLVKLVRESNLEHLALSIYRFTHGFIREYIYANLSRTRQRLFHNSVAQALEKLYTGRYASIAGLLARQLKMAHLPDKAASYFLLAAQEAYRRYAWKESILLAQSTLETCQELAQDDQVITQQAQAILTWELDCERLGEYDEVLGSMEAVIRLVAARPGLSELHVRLLIAQGWNLYYRSDRLSELTASKALSTAKKLQDVELVYQAQALLSDILVDDLGKYEQGRNILFAQLEIARDQGDIYKEIEVLAYLSWCLAHIGSCEQAVAAGRESLDLIKTNQVDDPILQSFAYRCLGFSLQTQGNYQASIQTIGEAIKIYERLNDQLRIHWCLSEIADALFEQGSFDEAKIRYQRSAEFSERVADQQQIAYTRTALAMIAIEQKDLDKAWENLQGARQALAEYEGVVESLWLNHALIHYYLAKQDHPSAQGLLKTTTALLEGMQSTITQVKLYNAFGRCALESGDPAGALEWHAKSLALSQQIRNLPGIADSHCLLGYVYLQMGDQQHATAHIDTARRVYKALKNDLRLQELERLSAPTDETPPGDPIFGQAAGILPRYASFIELSREYPSRYGNPSISRVDSAIFLKKYFVNCLDCKFCHDSCCAYGVDVDIENYQRIMQHAGDLEKLIGISRDLWFKSGIQSEADYPGGQFFRTRVIEGACVFLNREGRGCSLHQYCLEKGLDYHELKPMVSCLFPLTFDRGLLHPASEIYDESLICFASGPTLYQGLRQELLYYYGEAFIAELDEFEAKFLPVSPAQAQGKR